jgi:phosphoglucomutase
VAVKNDKGKYIIVNGNQTALLFIYYIITKMKEAGTLKGNEYVVKTIVSTELIAEIARKNNIEYYDVYTGFKFIAEIIRELEGKEKIHWWRRRKFWFYACRFCA